MTTSFDFLLQQPVLPEPTAVPSTDPAPSSVGRSVEEVVLGCGITRPLRRDGNGDFVHECAEDLIRASVGQILGTVAQSSTTAGEIPWRPEFGSKLHLLRHQNNDDVLEDVARAFVVQALDRWEPRVRVRAVTIERTGVPAANDLNVLRLKVRYDLAAQASGSSIVLKGITQSVAVPSG